MPQTAALSTESLGELCLGHLAETPEQLARFMDTTGYSPDRLRRAIGSRELAEGLVEYFAQNEPLMLDLCSNNRLRPEDFMQVWARLNPSY